MSRLLQLRNNCRRCLIKIFVVFFLTVFLGSFIYNQYQKRVGAKDSDWLIEAKPGDQAMVK